MKSALFTVFAMTAAAVVYAGGSHPIKAYVKKDGTYVAPSAATNPNSIKTDNYSSKGNVNPVSGKVGTKTPAK